MKRIALCVFSSLLALMLVGCGETTSKKETTTTTTVKTTPGEVNSENTVPVEHETTAPETTTTEQPAQ